MSQLFFCSQIGKLSAPFAIPDEIEARELKIRNYFLEEIERLTNEKHVYHIKNLAMAANVIKHTLNLICMKVFIFLLYDAHICLCFRAKLCMRS